MYISVLQRNKKSRKSLHFKRRVVEVYRAEIAQPVDIQQYLHIPLTELRQLNRWYFKHRLAPYLYPYRCYKSMKKHNQDAYVKALERRLAATEEENKLLKLKAEAFQTAIQIAEKQFQIPILKKSGRIGGPNQTVNQLTRRYPLVGMEQLCGLFGLTRQAWYAATRRQEKLGFQAAIVLTEVRRLRKQVAGLGTTKLYELMQDFLASHQIKLGRDRLHKLLKDNGLLLTKKRYRIKTTDSDHDLEKYPNQVKELKPDGPNQLWVSDLSYIRVGIGFAYLSVIMDAYSRKIVGCRAAGAVIP